MISVHFSRFETENKFDKVYIMDADGKVLSEMSGNNDGAFSVAVSGSSMSIRLVSDSSVNKYGFDIDKIAYK